MSRRESIIKDNQKAREAFYKELGEVDPYRLAEMLPGQFSNLNWATIRNGSTTYVVSEGLADPYSDAEPGLMIEVVMATQDPIEDIKSSWIFQVVSELSSEIDYIGHRVNEALDEMGVLSMSLRNVRDVPQTHIAPDGTVGIIFGIKSPKIPSYLETSSGKIRLVVVRLLFGSELEEILNHGEIGRNKLREKMESDIHPHLESLLRKSYVENGAALRQHKSISEGKISKTPPNGTPSTMFMVMSLNSRTKESDLREIFSKYGEIKKLSLKANGMALVEMMSLEMSINAANALHGEMVHGQPIVISFAQRVG